MMIEHKISRRALLKSAAKASVYATVGLSTSFATAAAIRTPVDTLESPLNKAEQFIFDTLSRSMGSSDKIQTSDIRRYSKDLIAHLGPNFDYKNEYSSLMGEYDLARQFIKSTDQYSNTKSDIESAIHYTGINTHAIRT